MSWDRTDQRIEAFYQNEHIVVGTVLSSRVKYGGTVQHTVELDTPTKLYGTLRDRLLIDESEVLGQLSAA